MAVGVTGLISGAADRVEVPLYFADVDRTVT
jgi:hypothetical protein